MPATSRPTVIVTSSMSLDGKVSLSRDRILLDPAARALWASAVHSQDASELLERQDADRAADHAEVILEGSGTFVEAGAGPFTSLPPLDPGTDVDALYTDFLPHPTPPKWFTVVDGHGRVDWDEGGGEDIRLLVLVSRAVAPEFLADLRRKEYSYLICGDDGVDLPLALQRLAETLGVTCVHSQAGGGLNGALLRAGLVDELDVLVWPALIGGADTPTLFDGSALGRDDVPDRLDLISATASDGGAVRLRYRVVVADDDRGRLDG